MNAVEQARFDELYEDMQQNLLLQGKRPKTIEGYSRGVRRVAEYFDRCPDKLTAADLKKYFASLVESHSWSTVKLDRNGIGFFCRHVLDKPWEWLNIVKPPQVQTLPDILSREETLTVINATRKLRYRVFFLTLYSMGLRLGEGLRMEVGDIAYRDVGKGREQGAEALMVAAIVFMFEMPKGERTGMSRCQT